MKLRKLYTMSKSIILLLCITALFGCKEAPSGVLIYGEGTLDGYTLYAGANKGPVYLIDMEGNIIIEFEDVTNFGTKMLPGGSVLGPDYLVPHEQSNNAVLQIAWDGALEWSYSHWENVPGWGWTARQHHDVQREGNPVGYYAPGQDFVEHGNTLILALADNFLHEDVCEGSEKAVKDAIIYEVDWDGNKTFEWNAADHITQFGYEESDMHLNCDGPSDIHSDYLHVNTISRLGENHWYDNGDTRFHPENIILDSRHHGWIIIIDHATGDVVWRVGPYYSEGYPEAVLEPIIGPHHAHMIPAGLPGAGNIIVFDNGWFSGFGITYFRNHSRVIEFDPTTLEMVWEYNPALGDRLKISPLISGVQRLPNGNTIITSGAFGRILEVTSEKEIVWEFKNCHRTKPGGTIYRSIRIPPQWLPEGENIAGYPDWEY